MAASERDAVLEFREFPGGADSTRLRPLVSADAAPHFAALARGRFILQCCSSCQRFRLPAGPVCPYCQGQSARWQPACGNGTVHSWTRYHRGFLPEFAALVPYVVLNVSLHEGPRLIGRWVDDGGVEIGMPVTVLVERWKDGLCVPAFARAGNP